MKTLNLNSVTRRLPAASTSKVATVLKLVTAKSPVYYIEEVTEIEGSLMIDYTLNDDWKEAMIQVATLKTFMFHAGLNDYCFDSSDQTGEHIQIAGSINTDLYFEQSLRFIVKSYLEANRIGQYGVN
jgi:3-keto-L-gulonate-6-phosphate decarboxylase